MLLSIVSYHLWRYLLLPKRTTNIKQYMKIIVVEEYKKKYSNTSVSSSYYYDSTYNNNDPSYYHTYESGSYSVNTCSMIGDGSD